MRIFKMLPLALTGLHFFLFTQEGPTSTPDEPTQQEQTQEQLPTEENQIPQATTESTAAIQQDQPTDQPTAQPKTIPETTSSEIAQQSDKSPAIEIPAVPEPVIEDTVPQEVQIIQSPVGIDTVSLEEPQGNWLFKRIWWERAEERYEKIRLLVDTIWRSRTEFFIERNELDRKVLDPFYINIGMSMGELQTILTEQIESLEKQRKQEGDLSEEERESFEALLEEQESLKQLKIDIDSIASLDHAIDNALDKLMQQINNARNLETQAWKNFKEIAHILNDTKARELYYMIEGAARNIKNISTYLEQSFFKHFKTLIREATNHIARVQQRMTVLKEKGIVFKSLAEQAALQEKEEQQAQEEEEQEEENKPKAKTGWIGWIVNGIKNTFKFLISIIRLPYDMIFGK